MAARLLVRLVAAPPARRVPDVRQGPAGADPRQAAAPARGVGGAHRALLARPGDRQGILLVQLRPDHERDDARLDWFLGRLPAGVRVAVELRHPSWHTTTCSPCWSGIGAAYVVMSGAGLPCVLARPRRSSTSGSTAPTTTTSTRARTPTPISPGGPTDPGVGRPGARRLGLLQQRRRRQRRAQRPNPPPAPVLSRAELRAIPQASSAPGDLEVDGLAHATVGLLR